MGPLAPAAGVGAPAGIPEPLTPAAVPDPPTDGASDFFAVAAPVPAGVAADFAVGEAAVSAAAISDIGSETDPPTPATEPSAEVLAPESSGAALLPRPDASASAPSRFPPFVEVCLLWPSASAVRATWSDRTLAKASVGGAPWVGGLVPWPSAVGGEAPASGVLGPPPLAGTAPAALAGPAEGASAVTAGIIAADPIPELMLPSGGSR
ncbi:MAG: hypothetical protein ACRDPM_21610 [Solirubrobacteraceae bacterium]